MNKRISTIVLSAVLTSAVAVAHASFINTLKSWHPYVQVNYLPTWLNAKGTSSIQIANAGNAADTFVAQNSTHANNFGFGAGVTIPLNAKRSWLSQLDLSLAYVNMKAVTVSGVHTMTILTPPIPFKYDFSYQNKMSLLYVDANMNLYSFQRYTFFGGLGIDYNWIKNSGFTETPQPGTTLKPDLHFDALNKKQWLYHLNIGVTAKLSSHIRVGVRDSYYPHIPIQIGPGKNGTKTIAAIKHHISMNQMSASLDYIF